MSAHRGRRPRVVRALRSRRERRAALCSDAGSVLLEAIVAMIVVSVVMVAVTGVLVTGSQTTTHQRNAQRAVHLATAAMDTAQALGSAAAIKGLDAPGGARKDPSVIATHPKVAALIGTMDLDAAHTAALTQTIDGVTYTTAYFLGDCWAPANGASGDCTRTGGAGKLAFTRVVTAVVWDGRNCPDGGCDYVTSGLLDTQTGSAVSERTPFTMTPPPATPIDLARLTGPVTVGYVTATNVLAPPLTYSGTVAKCGGPAESLVQSGETRSGFKLNPLTGAMTHVLPTAASVADQMGTFCFSITAVDAALNVATVEVRNWNVTLQCHTNPEVTRQYDGQYYQVVGDPGHPLVLDGTYYFKSIPSPLCRGGVKYRISGAGYTFLTSPETYTWGAGILKCESSPGTWTATPTNICYNVTGDIVIYNAYAPAQLCTFVEILDAGDRVVSSYHVLWKFLDHSGTPANPAIPTACRT